MAGKTAINIFSRIDTKLLRSLADGTVTNVTSTGLAKILKVLYYVYQMVSRGIFDALYVIISKMPSYGLLFCIGETSSVSCE